MAVVPTVHPGERKTSRALAAVADKFAGAFVRLTAPGCVAATLAALVLCDSAVLFLKAASKPLWYDELVTLHVSALHPFSALWSALQTGVDGMPPGYYAVVQIARTLPIDPHLAVRVPSIVGYILTLVGVYCFTRKRISAPAALVAALLVSVSSFRPYAVEARPYALLVGSLAIAAVFWQRIGEMRCSAVLFGLFLAFAVSLHYLAVVAISVFVIAELAATVISRRIRWGVWAACATACVPFFLTLPTLLHFRAVFGRNFWSRPDWKETLMTYQTYVEVNPSLVLVLLVFLALAVAVAVRRRAGSAAPRFTTPELMLAAGFLFYPALLVVMTKLAGSSGYVPRYGWPAMLGFVLLGIDLIGNSVRSLACLVVALLLGFACQDVFELATWSPANRGLPAIASETERWAKLQAASAAAPTLPVAIGSPVTFLEASEYAPAPLRARLLEVANPDEALRYTHADSADKANRLLARFVPLRVEELGSFEAANREFILCSCGPVDWMTPYFLGKGYRLSMLSHGEGEDDSIYLVTRGNP